MVIDFDAEIGGDDNRGRRRRQRRQAASKAMLLTSAEASSGAEDENMKRAIKESTAAATANGLDEKKRDDLIAKAAAKAERKRKRKEEKARRKAEKKAKKKLEETVNNGEGGGGKDSDIEILEDDNGVCVLSIQPKPIKLTIKTNGHSTAAATSDPPTHDTPSPSSSAAKKTSSRDVRTQCDKCQEPGDNYNLVRCDECKKCFHFRCLIPPVTKSPKRPGWGWHCNECDPSDRDSDWHLD